MHQASTQLWPLRLEFLEVWFYLKFWLVLSIIYQSLLTIRLCVFCYFKLLNYIYFLIYWYDSYYLDLKWFYFTWIFQSPKVIFFTFQFFKFQSLICRHMDCHVYQIRSYIFSVFKFFIPSIHLHNLLHSTRNLWIPCVIAL